MSATLPKATAAAGIILLIAAAALYVINWSGPIPGFSPASEQSASAVGDSFLSEEKIANLRMHAENRPDDVGAQLELVEAYLQRGRETEESSYHLKAEQTLLAALEMYPENLALLTAMGRVSLGMHQFEDAKVWGTRALERDNDSAVAHAVVADAQIELGEYEGALQHVQAMLDIDPDVNAYTRAAYLRELYGDVEGALAAHERSVEIMRPLGEPAASARSTLGDLYFQIGRAEDAKRMYTDALRIFPGHLGSREGLAQVLSSQGDSAGALKEYEKLIEARPDVGHLAGAGDILAGMGDSEAAKGYYDRALAFVSQLEGLDRFLYTREIVMFYADHGLNTEEAVRLAKEELAIRKDIYGYDALAWALYNHGSYEEAAEMAGQSMRLGTQDPNLFYHAGLIEMALGDKAAASGHFERVIEINPQFQAPGDHPSPDTLVVLLDLGWQLPDQVSSERILIRQQQSPKQTDQNRQRQAA